MLRQFCVISHTHWDREWYQSFEEYRYRFVKLMDNLLDIYKAYPDYVFYMDAQTHVIEDYLEIRPHRKEEVYGYIKSGNLLVGPWYIQGDFHLTSGEATIRNLLIGSRLAESFGGCQHTGYTPDQFGICSQVPQIFNGFGLKAIVFGRGYKKFDVVDGELKQRQIPTEFMWEGPDGSQILGVSMHHWYNNAQRFSAELDNALALVNAIEDVTADIALTPYILLMNGVDHLEAQEDLLPIMTALNKRLPEGKALVQMGMDTYIDNVTTWLMENPQSGLGTVTGEMRHGAQHILMNTASSRVYLKQANFATQNRLEVELEPLYAHIFALGATDLYPHDHFRYLWRLLMENHPHDSICGCSVDDVHAEMETRFAKVNNMCDALQEDALTWFTNHLDRTGLDQDDYLLALFNTTEVTRKGVIEADLTFPQTEDVTNFKLISADGQAVPYTVLDKQPAVRRTLSPINLPGTLDVDSYRVQLLSEPLAPLSYEALHIKPCEGEVAVQTNKTTIATDTIVLENEMLSLSVQPTGQVDLTVKATDRTYEDVLTLVDREDCGQSYLYRKSEHGKTIRSNDFTPVVEHLSKTPFRQQCKLSFDRALPTHFDYHHDRRAEQTRNVPIAIILTLDAGSKGLQIDIDIDNTVIDHRIRAEFNTGYNTEICYAGQAFDIIARKPHHLAPQFRNPDEPNNGLLFVQGEHDGMAVFNKGLYEYEYPAAGEGKLAVTLIRANNRFSGNGPYVVPPESLTPGNQCLRKLSFELMLMPFSGDYLTAQVTEQAKTYHNPLLSIFQPVDRTKFTGGRPAVQASGVAELFFRPLDHADIVLPRARQLVEIEGDNIQLSALKRAEDSDMLVLRLWNAGESVERFSLVFQQPVKRAALLNLNEEEQSEIVCTDQRIPAIVIKPKEIVTVGVWLF